MGLDKFKKKATVATPKSKSKTPTINIPEIEDDVNAWYDAHGAKKDAEAQMELHADPIKEAAEDARMRISMENGENESSIKINGKIVMSTKNAYSKIDPALQPQLEEIFGSDTERFFAEETTIELNNHAKQDEEFLDKLIELVGEDNVEKYFNITTVLKPTTAFHEERSTKHDTAAKAAKAIEKGLVRPFSPSLKKA